MNKSIISIIVGTVILALLILLLFRNRSPFGKNNTSFASEPKNEITRIELSQGKQKIIIEKAGENWLMNGKTEARKSGVLFITRVLKEIKIKSPISPELFESEINTPKIEPVKVMVYEKRKLLKTFIVYKTNSNVYGNIIKIGVRSKPFIGYLPGFDGDIGSAFTLNELFWQPYTVFDILPSEIASVDFENVTDTVNSFTVQKNNRLYSLSYKTQNLSGWDTALVTRYLSYFIRIPFESWVLDLDKNGKENISSGQLLYRITVQTKSGSKTTLSLWEKTTVENGSQRKDSDRLYGKTEDYDEFFIIRYFDIDPLLKKRSYFFTR